MRGNGRVRSEVLGETTLEVNGADYVEDSLLVVTSAPVEAGVGDVLRITGTVGQFPRVTEGEAPIYNQSPELYEEYETEAYLHDATVEHLTPG